MNWISSTKAVSQKRGCGPGRDDGSSFPARGRSGPSAAGYLLQQLASLPQEQNSHKARWTLLSSLYLALALGGDSEYRFLNAIWGDDAATVRERIEHAFYRTQADDRSLDGVVLYFRPFEPRRPENLRDKRGAAGQKTFLGPDVRLRGQGQSPQRVRVGSDGSATAVRYDEARDLPALQWHPVMTTYQRAWIRLGGGRKQPCQYCDVIAPLYVHKGSVASDMLGGHSGFVRLGVVLFKRGSSAPGERSGIRNVGEDPKLRGIFKAFHGKLHVQEQDDVSSAIVRQIAAQQFQLMSSLLGEPVDAPVAQLVPHKPGMVPSDPWKDQAKRGRGLPAATVKYDAATDSDGSAESSNTVMIGDDNSTEDAEDDDPTSSGVQRQATAPTTTAVPQPVQPLIPPQRETSDVRRGFPPAVLPWTTLPLKDVASPPQGRTTLLAEAFMEDDEEEVMQESMGHRDGFTGSPVWPDNLACDWRRGTPYPPFDYATAPFETALWTCGTDDPWPWQ